MPGCDRKRIWVAILAGGAGNRFWPLSTPKRPKQLLALAGEKPLIAQTVDRLRGFVPEDRMRILTRADLVAPIRAATGLPADLFLLETRPRDTAPVLARMAWELHCTDPDAVMVSLHADHLIAPAARLREVLGAAAAIARRESLLMTVAIPPDRPEIGFGYIRPGSPLPAPIGHRACRVAAFVEKPSAARAAAFIAEGYRWNSGIFVWPTALFLSEIRAHAPEVARALPRLEEGDVEGFLDETEPISVDEAVLERSARVGAIDATFRWDDIGSWESLARHRSGDEAGNIAEGQVEQLDSAGNLAISEGRRLVLFGVDDLLVVQTEETTLVMPRAESHRLKEYLARLPAEAR